MNFFLATVFMTTFLVAQGRPSNFEFDKWYNAIRSKNEGRIISGKEAVLGQFPYQALLLMTPIGGNEPTYICGGSLINNNYVLTAAHCVRGYSSWYIKLGGIRLDRPEESQIIMLTTTSIIHENYDPEIFQNDIALIKLPVPVKYNDYIKPLRLPSRSEAALNLTDTIVRISGWGKTSDTGESSVALLFVDVSIISNDDCKEVFEEAILPSSICAVGFPEHNACEGDSGGPLTRVAEDGQRTHVGLVSFGLQGMCTFGYPTVYSRTTSYLDWINKHTGIEIRP